MAQALEEAPVSPKAKPISDIKYSGKTQPVGIYSNRVPVQNGFMEFEPLNKKLIAIESK